MYNLKAPHTELSGVYEVHIAKNAEAFQYVSSKTVFNYENSGLSQNNNRHQPCRRI